MDALERARNVFEIVGGIDSSLLAGSYLPSVASFIAGSARIGFSSFGIDGQDASSAPKQGALPEVLSDISRISNAGSWPRFEID